MTVLMHSYTPMYTYVHLHSCALMYTDALHDTMIAKLYRAESGLDDLDNLGHLGHFFGGSSGSHPQTKLCGCDPDITCSLKNSVGIW